MAALGGGGSRFSRAAGDGKLALSCKRPVRGRRRGRADRLEDIVSEQRLVDITGRLRSPATTPGHWAGCAPPNKGLRFPADPPTVEEISLSCAKLGQARTRTGSER